MRQREHLLEPSAGDLVIDYIVMYPAIYDNGCDHLVIRLPGSIYNNGCDHLVIRLPGSIYNDTA